MGGGVIHWLVQYTVLFISYYGFVAQVLKMAKPVEVISNNISEKYPKKMG